MPPMQACDVCFKRKIQCFRPSPGLSCNWCTHQSIKCTFTREKKINTAKRIKAKDVEKLLGRIKQLENSLVEASMHQCLPATTLSDRWAGCEPVTQHNLLGRPSQIGDDAYHDGIAFTTRLFRKNWYRRGMPLISVDGIDWIENRADQKCSVLRAYVLRNSASRPYQRPLAHPERMLDVAALELPNRNDSHRLFDDLSLPLFQLFFPMLNRELFRSTIEMAYLTYHGQNSARACLWAAFAVMRCLKLSSETLRSLDERTCAVRARLHLDVADGFVRQEDLQAILLLHKYQMFTGQYNNAGSLLSIACRMVCELNGHSYELQRPNSVELESTISLQQRSHTRKLFWLCYTMDKDLALLSGQPPMLANEYCDMSAPGEHLNHGQFLHPSSDEVGSMSNVTWERVISFLPGDPRLGMLKNDIYRLLYAPVALEIIDSELLVRVRQLDNDLENWRLSIPSTLRPQLLTFQDQLRRPAPPILSHVRSIQLQLEYDYLLTVIHAAVRRFGAALGAESSLPHDLHSVMHSSTDLSLEASRSTLFLVREPIAKLEHEAFWNTVPYVLVAVMSLFVNILMHPESPRAQKDVESIRLVSRMVDTMSMHEITYQNASHFQQMREVMAELSRVANGAASKAASADVGDHPDFG